jgi:hypothetical protein
MPSGASWFLKTPCSPLQYFQSICSPVLGANDHTGIGQPTVCEQPLNFRKLEIPIIPEAGRMQLTHIFVGNSEFHYICKIPNPKGDS